MLGGSDRTNAVVGWICLLVFVKKYFIIIGSDRTNAVVGWIFFIKKMGIVHTFSILSCYCDDQSSFYSGFAIFTACIVNILGP
jgi:hypothetical protein